MQQADNSNLNVQVTYFKAPPSEETPIEEDKFISPFILSSQLVFEGAACAEAAVENQPAPTSTSTAKKALFEGRLPVTVKSFALEGDSVQMVNALAATEFLLKEAEKMMELKHPRLVKLLGVLMDSVGLIVFEFMANGSLKEFIQRHATNSIPLAWSVRHQLAKDVAEGLSFLHSSSPPVFHQGLTSETVLLTMEGAILRAKISDAGLVDVKLRAAKEDTSGFASSVAACPMIMNRHYTAPELFRGNKKVRIMTRKLSWFYLK